MSAVLETVRVSTITRIPHAPYSVRGIINVRGRVVPVMGLRTRIGLDEGELDRHSRIVIANSRGRSFGLLVDSVQQVVIPPVRRGVGPWVICSPSCGTPHR